LNRRTLSTVLLTALLAWSALATVGCAKRYKIEVESNTCWTWSADGQGSTVSRDCGNARYRVAGKIDCVTITNSTDTGYVRIRIDGGPWAESTAPQGSAKACR
jgi:hypothetical protein